jgi:hypothetical protein
MILTPSPSVPQAIKPAKSAGSFYASQAMNVYRSVRSFAYVLAWSSTAFGIIGTHTLHTHALHHPRVSISILYFITERIVSGVGGV